MNVQMIFFILIVILIITLGYALLSVHAVKPITRKCNTISFIIAIVSFCLVIVNGISLDIGLKQKPVTVKIVKAHIPVNVSNTFYENGNLFITIEGNKVIQIPNDTMLLQPTVCVNEIFVRKEWTFLFPFYLEDTEYEYLGD